MRTVWRLGAILGTALGLTAREARAEVYGFTNDKGILILSNVPSDPRMRLIAGGGTESPGRSWHYKGHYDPLILGAAQQVGLDQALVKAVIAIESGFDRFALSRKGAQGLMQLMPETARRYGVSNIYDPSQNVRAGSRHLRDLLDEFGDLPLALAAYNAGAEVVRKLGRIPPYRETLNYVRRVLAVYRAGSRISITKGGKIYTIGSGGRVETRPAPMAAANQASPRESEPETLPGESSPANEPAPAGPSAQGALAPGGGRAREEPDGPVYFRYRDPSGVIYITRTKPTTGDYEILR